MRILQLNVQKQRSMQQGIMNEVTLEEYAALVVSEPYIFEMNGKIVTNPIGHQVWTAILPSERHDGR